MDPSGCFLRGSIRLLVVLELARARNIDIPGDVSSSGSSLLYSKILTILRDSEFLYSATIRVLTTTHNSTEQCFPVKILHGSNKAIILHASAESRVDLTILEMDPTRTAVESAAVIQESLPFLINSDRIVLLVRDDENVFTIGTEKWIENLLADFDKNQLHNVIAIVKTKKELRAEGPSKLRMFTYFPHERQHLKNVDHLVNPFRSFRDKFVNLNLDVIRVGAVNGLKFYEKEDNGTELFGGLDAMLMTVMSEKMNATFEVEFANTLYGLRPDKLTQIPVFKELDEGTLDYIASGRFAIVRLGKRFDYSYPRKMVSIVFLLPRNVRKTVDYLSLVVYNIVPTVLLVMLLSWLTSFLTGRFQLRAGRGARVSIFDVFKFVLGQSDGVAFATRISGGARCLLGSWMIFSLVWSAYLQTFVTSRVVSPYLGAPIETIDDLLEFRVPIVTHKLYYLNIINSVEPTAHQVLERNVIVNDSLFHSLQPNLGYMANTETAWRLVRDPHMHMGGVSYFYLCRHTISTFLMTYYHRKRSPLLRRFDEILARVVEAGIYDQWQLQNKVEVNWKVSDLESDWSSVNYVDLRHLKFVFVLYVVGIFAAVVAFYYERKNGPRRNK